MFRIMILCTLLPLTFVANAIPVTFTFAEYSSDSNVGIDASTDGDSTTIEVPPQNNAALPAITNAFIDGNSFDDFASADAVADNLLDEISLATAVEASIDATNGSLADASAVASFFGEFAGSGLYNLQLDFESLTERFVAGINDASAELFLRLTIGVNTIVDTSFVLTQAFDISFDIADASTATLDIVLIGDAFSEGGNISNIANVDFTLDVRQVPENSTLALCLVALGIGAMSLRHKQNPIALGNRGGI